MKKYGRPKQEEKTVRKLTIGVRVNEEELQALQKKAKQMHVPPATWLRLAGIQRQINPPMPAVNLIAYKQLIKIATNLNQLMKFLHAGGYSSVMPKISNLLPHLLAEVQTLQKQVLGV